MPRRILRLSLTLLVILCAASLSAETLFLKDGSIIKGKVIKETASEVTFQAEDGKRKAFARSQVLRIQYGEIFLGKQYIQLWEGEVIEGYVVDEDQETYTVRTDITKVDEFTVDKADVMYLVRTNPRRLKGIVQGKSIHLTWFPPLGEVTGYRVYMKINAEGNEYKMMGETDDTSFTIEGLDVGTKYIVKVTGIMPDGTETIPSNEFKFSMMCLPPDSIWYTAEDGGNGTVNLVLSWDVPDDSRATGFNVYEKKGNTYRKIVTTDKKTTVIENIDPFIDNIYIVRSLSAEGDESAAGNDYTVRLFSSWYWTFLAGAVVPTGYSSGQFGVGLGGSVIFSNSLSSQLHWGASLSCYGLAGDSSANNISWWMYMPLTVEAGANIRVSYQFIVQPYAGVGYAFEAVTHDKLDTQYALDLILTAGVRFHYKKGIFITPFVEYQWVPDTRGHIGMIIIGAGVTL